MAFRDISLSIHNFFESITTCLRDPQKYNLYMRYLLYGLVICAVAGVSFVGRGWYIASRERAAEKDLSLYITQYYNAMNAQQARWEQVASLFEVGYSQHSRSYLAPDFLMYQSEALLQQGALDSALKIMKKVLEITPESAPFYQLFRMKYNLVVLDVPDHPDRDLALAALYEIGSDKTNNFFEIALFYLARYHFVHHNINDARALWQELCAAAVDENPSPFVKEAEEYLQLVG